MTYTAAAFIVAFALGCWVGDLWYRRTNRD